MRLVPGEREALCDLFGELGPEAPTVLPGWRASELLAHLLVRERQPLAAPGILISPLAQVTEVAMRRYAQLPWKKQIALLRGGAPLWSPYRVGPVDERANLIEFVVHHEDLSRAQPGWQPRELSERLQEALWSALRLSARVMYRKCPVGVVLRHPTRPQGNEINAKSGTPRVVVTGPPAELILHSFGRELAQVQLGGAPADVAALNDTPRGI
ncbi:MAG TPA: TIGR03085 family metal-binding protein [Pseudonocardia sp.]|jgi:uncharacterized protein (TIGR03085 family)